MQRVQAEKGWDIDARLLLYAAGLQHCAVHQLGGGPTSEAVAPPPCPSSSKSRPAAPDGRGASNDTSDEDHGPPDGSPHAAGATGTVAAGVDGPVPGVADGPVCDGPSSPDAPGSSGHACAGAHDEGRDVKSGGLGTLDVLRQSSVKSQPLNEVVGPLLSSCDSPQQWRVACIAGSCGVLLGASVAFGLQRMLKSQ